MNVEYLSNSDVGAVELWMQNTVIPRMPFEDDSVNHTTEEILLWLAGGVATEGLELSDKVRKALLHWRKRPNDLTLMKDVLDEAGDVLWYLAALLYKMRIDLKDVLVENSEKLKNKQNAWVKELRK